MESNEPLQVLHLTSKKTIPFAKCTVQIDNLVDQIGEFHVDNSCLDGEPVDLNLLIYRASRLANLSVKYCLGTLNCDVMSTFFLTGKPEWVTRAPKNADVLKWLPIASFPFGEVSVSTLKNVEMIKIRYQKSKTSTLIVSLLVVLAICLLVFVLLFD